MDNLQKRIEHVEKEIQNACQQAGRQREDVTLIAVTKQVSVQRTLDIINNGFSHIGENRPEGLLKKQSEISDSAVWHFIGNLQSRKVKEIINGIDYLHSIDRLSIVKEIQKRADQPVNCFLQVNVSGEASKSGISPHELQSFIEQAAEFDKVSIVGLMTMAPFTEDENEIRSVFRSLRELRDITASKQYKHAPCTFLSMGMSNDYKIAVEEGATHIRIGTALVGAESEA